MVLHVKEKSLFAGWTKRDQLVYEMRLERKKSPIGLKYQGDQKMARHKKHERKKELDRKRRRRKKALKIAVKKAIAAKS